ncbi:MAG: hypothetical protein ABSB24_02815 [Gaiellaceae bacterium]
MNETSHPGEWPAYAQAQVSKQPGSRRPAPYVAPLIVLAEGLDGLGYQCRDCSGCLGRVVHHPVASEVVDGERFEHVAHCPSIGRPLILALPSAAEMLERLV